MEENRFQEVFYFYDKLYLSIQLFFKWFNFNRFEFE